MASNKNISPGVSRRSFITATAVAAAGTAVAGRSLFAAAAQTTAAGTPAATAMINYARALVESYGRPNSKFNGVMVGTITYSFRSLPSSAEDLLRYCVALGYSGVEMMGPPAEQFLSGAGGGRGGLPGGTPAQNDAFTAMTTALTPLANTLQTARTNLATASLGVPKNDAAIRAAADAVGAAELALAQARAEQLGKIQGSANKLNAEQVATVVGANGGPAAGRGGGRGGAAGGAPAAPAPMPTWMNAEGLAKLADLKRMYNEAGVTIYALKNITSGVSDAELDYRFQMVKALGANHGTLELPGGADPSAAAPAAVTERLGAFGKKHGVYVGYHTHTQARPNSFDTAFRQSDFNRMNLDVGHYQGGNQTSALPLLEKYHDKVASIHLKDKTNADQNMPWGQGNTPLIEILRTIRDQKWTFPASVEFEYNAPQGSNALIEMGRCRGYAAAALMT